MRVCGSMIDDRVIYAIIAVLACLVLWGVLRQWKRTDEDAKNLRLAAIIMGAIIAAAVVWQCTRV
jgi:hypothetical protein